MSETNNDINAFGNELDLREEPGAHWQTLEQWAQDPEFSKIASAEFLSSPIRESQGTSGIERRDFLKLMGASIAMASTACVRRPAQKIVPYAKQPEEVTFAVSNYYTSTFFDGQEAVGLLVKTREGRPIKVEGLPKHPMNQGGLMARAQAHILSLYDPDRLKGPKKNLLNEKRDNRDTISSSWDEADKAIVEELKKGGVAILTGNVASPASSQLIADFCQGFKAKHYQWEPISQEEIRHGQEVCYGEAVVPSYRFDLAKLIVSIDADFLGTWLAPTSFSKQFSQGRRNLKSMSRLVVFDSNYSLTGANADLRIRMAPSQQVSVAMGLAHALVVKLGKSRFASVSGVRSQLESYSGVEAELALKPGLLTELAQNLWENRGQSLVVAGGLPTQTSDALSLQIAVNFLNSALENEGVSVLRSGFSWAKASHQSLIQLRDAMKRGEVRTLIISKSNPLYAAPLSLGFEDALKNVKLVISTSDRMDETSQASHYVLPESHSMESWNDVQFVDGVRSLQQPTLRALYDTRSFQLSLMTWAYMADVGPERIRKFESFYDYLRNHWKENVYPKWGLGKSFDVFWDQALETGYVGGIQASSSRNFRVEALAKVKKALRGDGLELVLYPSVQLGEGSLNNVAWLQELPDPVTKVVWDNTLNVSLAMAEKWGFKQGDIVELQVGEQTLEAPILLQPGLHDSVVGLAVGYGRWATGKVGNKIGVNSYDLVQVGEKSFVFSGQSVQLKKTKKRTEIATTAGHHV
ncbi:MAG: TAT-variant-translocated molybdopterin oxidoreductase, partial [Bdellovibrio sp.]